MAKNKWLGNYNICKEYYVKNHNLLMPVDYTINNTNVYKWLRDQRTLYNKQALSNEKVSLLNNIGMVWNLKDYKWQYNYKLAREYFIKNHNLLIPRDYVVNNTSLGLWIVTQRQNKHKLSKDKIILLESIGMVWQIRKNNYSWDEAYKLANNYYQQNGNLLIPRNYLVDGYKLGRWITIQRSNYSKGKLNQRQIKLLDNVNMIWQMRKRKRQRWLVISINQLVPSN